MLFASMCSAVTSRRFVSLSTMFFSAGKRWLGEIVAPRYYDAFGLVRSFSRLGWQPLALLTVGPCAFLTLPLYSFIVRKKVPLFLLFLSANAAYRLPADLVFNWEGPKEETGGLHCCLFCIAWFKMHQAILLSCPNLGFYYFFSFLFLHPAVNAFGGHMCKECRQSSDFTFFVTLIDIFKCLWNRPCSL